MPAISNITNQGHHQTWLVFVAGFAVGALGGLIGLGGAEFRLPLLIGVFGFVALEAVIVNKAISLVVVGSALVFRHFEVPWSEVVANWSIVLNILCGSVIGAWLGADIATRLPARALYRVIAVLLIIIAAVLAFGHEVRAVQEPAASGYVLVLMGIIAGVLIGAIAAVLGVAGGEFLIPTLVLLFGVDMKLAGSLSLAISLPSMLVAFARYSRDGSFAVLRENRHFVVVMALASIAGALAGAALLAFISSAWLVPLLALILVVSAVKLWSKSFEKAAGTISN